VSATQHGTYFDQSKMLLRARSAALTPPRSGAKKHFDSYLFGFDLELLRGNYLFVTLFVISFVLAGVDCTQTRALFFIRLNFVLYFLSD
jgi:hypothetical protein